MHRNNSIIQHSPNSDTKHEYLNPEESGFFFALLPIKKPRQ